MKAFEKILWRALPLGLAAGLAGGLPAVCYRAGVEWADGAAQSLYAALRERPLFIVPWLFLIAAAGALLARLIRAQPLAVGSGISQVGAQLGGGLNVRWAALLPVKFFAGVLGAVFGLSLGRGGPSVQLGAAGGQAAAEKLAKNQDEKTALIAAGAAAGLAAAFGAPLAATVFVFEKYRMRPGGFSGAAAATAALTAGLLTRTLFGPGPVLRFFAPLKFPWIFCPWLLLLGAAAGLLGALLDKAIWGFAEIYRRMPQAVRPAAALAAALVCGLFFPRALGGGMDLIEHAEPAGAGVRMLLLFLAVKFLFTCVSYGSGVPGGVFLPVLALGALCGSLAAAAAVRFGLSPAYTADFAVCAMAGAVTGAMKTPAAAVLLVAEVTGSPVLLLPAAACAAVAYLLTGRRAGEGIKNKLFGFLKSQPLH